MLTIYSILLGQKSAHISPIKSLKCAKRKTKRPEKVNPKIITYISYWGLGYSKQALDDVKIISYDSKTYIPQTLRRNVLHWYHLYINFPGVSIIAKKIREVCYWKDLVTQA